MKKLVAFLTPFVLIALILACSKIDKDNYSTDNEHIKSISINGEIVHKYFYDVAGRIVEENCRTYFKRYLYNENGQLVKVEEAWNNAAISSSSSAFVGKTEFITSQNSAVSNYSLYEYDNAGRLVKTKHYFKSLNDPNGKFEHSSTRTFEYEGTNIVRKNWYDPETEQTGLMYEYIYDNKGNILKEKNYSSIGSKPELVSETSYKYDNFKNPFRIFSITGSHGMYTNVNNIIEQSFFLYRTRERTTSKPTYKYNENGYPVRAIYKDSIEEYEY